MHQGVPTSVPSGGNQTPLDLNLSQKASQNPFKGHDEPETSHQKAFEALTGSQPECVPKAADVFTSNANGCIVSSAETLSEHTGEQEGCHGLPPQQNLGADSVAAARTAPNEASVEDGPLIPAPISAGRKRKSPRVEAAANAQKELLQSGTAVLEDISTPGNGPTLTSPDLKRKSPRVKQTTSDITKKVILALEANEDEGSTKPKGRPRGSSDLSKDVVLHTPRSRSKSLVAKGDTPDLAERRLLLEERKIRLAEQRFALEEKKLEATIEIGKGLIISMERMTNTISNLGNSSSRH